MRDCLCNFQKYRKYGLKKIEMGGGAVSFEVFVTYYVSISVDSSVVRA